MAVNRDSSAPNATGARTETLRRALRELPAVEQLADRVGGPRPAALAAARTEIAALRKRLEAGDAIEVDHEQLRCSVAERVARLAAGSLRPVINATGVILHTNLGRAPLAPEVADAVARIGASYANLEYDLDSGTRGSRHSHVDHLLADLTSAEAAFAVNNNAAAVMLAVAALAGGGEVIVGRDQLVEIGGSFRIPEILAHSGVRLVEVGTTNRTRVGDYAAAICERTTALMRVHQSNFRTVGFTETPSIEELCTLASGHGIAVIDDLGSGAIDPIGDEPVVAASVRAGSTIACFSADKLLGGPQAGVLAGRRDAVERCRHHPLARAVRIDKLQLAALEATLRLRRDHGPEAVPVAAMLSTTAAELTARAAVMADLIGSPARVEQGISRAGGGTLPTLELPGPVCMVDPGPAGAEALIATLRNAATPVIARIVDGLVVLDPRAMDDAQARIAGQAVRAALG